MVIFFYVLIYLDRYNLYQYNSVFIVFLLTSKPAHKSYPTLQEGKSHLCWEFSFMRWSPFILLNQKELYNSIGMTTNNTNKTLEKYTMHIVYVGSKPKAMIPFNLKTCVMLYLILKLKVKWYQTYTFSD